MLIEGYLFVNWRGQFRFAVDMYPHEIRPIMESLRRWDIYWDLRPIPPTLHELTDPDYVKMHDEFKPLIHEGLKEFRRVMQISPKAKFKKEFSEGYIEFVNVG